MAKAIDSVLMQTFSDFELIIMDDGSTDGSFDVVLQTIEGHKDCHIYKQKNGGVSVARNNGVLFSQGDYLCFLDADDWWDPTFLEEMDQLVSDFPDTGIYGTNYTIINESRHKTRVASIGVEPGFEKGYINYCKVYAKTMYMPLWTGAVCIPRIIFDEMHGFPKGIKLGEDFLLWIRIALQHKVVFFNKPLSNYNQDVDGLNRGVGHLHDPKSHMLWNMDFLEAEEKSNPDLKQLLDNLRVFSMMPYLLSKEYHEAARQELAKVNWEKQQKKTRRRYQKPIAMLKIETMMTKAGFMAKCFVRRCMR